MKAASIRYLAITLFASTLASAGVVFNNGSPNQTSGWEMTSYLVGDDFTFASRTTFNDIRFWSYEPTGSTAYQGFIVWTINYDNSGLPSGPTFLTGAGTTAKRTDLGAMTGAWTGYELFQEDLPIAPLTLDAGTYFLVLHNGDINFHTPESFYWGTTDNNGTYHSANFNWSATPMPGPWVSSSLSAPVGEAQMAFELIYATPEPGTWFLVGTGTAALIARRRARRLNSAS